MHAGSIFTSDELRTKYYGGIESPHGIVFKDIAPCKVFVLVLVSVPVPGLAPVPAHIVLNSQLYASLSAIQLN